MPILSQECKTRLSRELYERYANHYRFRRHDGTLMPVWHDLTDDEQRLWYSLVKTVADVAEGNR